MLKIDIGRERRVFPDRSAVFDRRRENDAALMTKEGSAGGIALDGARINDDGPHPRRKRFMKMPDGKCRRRDARSQRLGVFGERTRLDNHALRVREGL